MEPGAFAGSCPFARLSLCRRANRLRQPFVIENQGLPAGISLRTGADLGSISLPATARAPGYLPPGRDCNLRNRARPRTFYSRFSQRIASPGPGVHGGDGRDDSAPGDGRRGAVSLHRTDSPVGCDRSPYWTGELPEAFGGAGKRSETL